MVVEPEPNPAFEIVRLLQPIAVQRALHLYDDIWQANGLFLSLHYDAFDRHATPLPFDEVPEWQRVCEFAESGPQTDLSSAQRAAQLLRRLIDTGGLDQHFDAFAAAGFHVTPRPVPQPAAGFLPRVFILGAAKCATTTMHAYLNRIDGVCMSEPKEPVFFEAEYELGLWHYQRRYFRQWRGEAIIGEARQRNLYLPFVPQRIFNTNPNARLIAMLRNPVDRAYSHWWHRYSRGIEALGFEEAIHADLERISRGYDYTTTREQRIHQRTLDAVGPGLYRTYVDGGYYDVQLERYLALFPRDQILTILFDDIIQRPFDVIRETEAFIGTDFYRRENFEVIHDNEAFAGLPGRIREPMRPEFRDWLTVHFRPSIERTADLIGRDLSHWL